MELVDAAIPLLAGVVATTDVEEACNGVDVAVLVGARLVHQVDMNVREMSSLEGLPALDTLDRLVHVVHEIVGLQVIGLAAHYSVYEGILIKL